VQRENSPDEVRLRGVFDGMDVDMIVAQPFVFGVANVPTGDFSDERVPTSTTRNIDANGLPTRPTLYKQWLGELCPFCGTLQADGFWFADADTGLDGGACANSFHHADLPASRIRYGNNFDQGDTSFCDPGTNLVPTLHDTLGHGTGVVGTAAGDPPAGAATDSGGFYYGSGIAPSAGIFMTKINVTPAGTTAIATSATDARVTASPPVYIQNHSYNQYQGDTTKHCGDAGFALYDGKYSLMSRDFDRAVRSANNNPPANPITLTASAGNQHQQPAQYATCTDIRLTLPPATAKNLIAMGGAESVRSVNEQWQCASNQSWSRAESFSNIQSDSKRGTLNASWFKPDLMAPSSLVSIQRSADAFSAQFCPGITFISSAYQVSVGTSFAAPAGAAAALLASRVYAEALQPNCHPNCNAGAASPALLKAMLVMSARSMRGGQDRAFAPTWLVRHTYAVGDVVTPTTENGHIYRANNAGTTGQSNSGEPVWLTASGAIVQDNSGTGITWVESGLLPTIGSLPNGLQGFGRLHLEDLLNAYPARDYVNETRTLTSLGPSWTKTYQVHDASLPVKVVLTWTDTPALENETDKTVTTTNPLVNDLSLAVDLGSPCTTRYIGNRMTVIDTTRGEESQVAGCADVNYDTVNNVELVKFFPSVNGATQFTVRVTAANGVGSQNFALVAYNAYDVSGSAPPAVPANFNAIATASQVNLSWTASISASSYDVQRQANGGFFTTIPAPSGTSTTDTGVAANTGYLYRVRARNATGVSAWAYHFATTMVFTDDPIAANAAVIKKVHIDELRTAINAVRAAVGLSAYGFSETLVVGTSTIKATHVNELRAALDQARAAAGLPGMTYTDNSLTQGSTIVKAIHLQELRNSVQ
jgi:hypothetical protein